MFTDYFRLALIGIKQKGVRSLLTMIGIFIGIAMVVSLLSLGSGLQEAVNEQFQMMGTNIILIMPGAGLESMMGSSVPVTEHDVDIIKKTRGVDVVGGLVTKISKVEYKDEVKYTWISGFPQDEARKIVEDMQQMKLESGRDLREEDKYKVLVGYMVAHGDFFEKEVNVRDKILINNQEFEVVGTLESIGNPQDDSSMLIPLETAKELFDTDEYIMIMAKTKEGFDSGAVANDIKEKLRKDRELKEGEENFAVQTMEELKDVYSVVLNLIQIFLVGLAAISLLVGGVGIMNTMYTSVLERTNEIGIMKAVGARNSDIMSIFLIESGMLGAAGGIIGCAIGLGISKSVEFAVKSQGIEYLKASTSPEIIFGAIAFAFIVGAVSGVIPARQAAQLKPVDALRYE
jgi:putative ABC transport system permease protein